MDDPQREFTSGPKFKGGLSGHPCSRIRRAVLVTLVGVSLAWLGGSPHAEEAPFSGQPSGQFPETGAVDSGLGDGLAGGQGASLGAEEPVAGSGGGGAGARVGGPNGSGSRGDRGASGEAGQGLGVGGAVSGDVAGAEVSRVASAGEVIGFSHVDASGSQRITLVNTGKSWMAVYHIDRAGAIRLVSSRPIDADFSLQLNATSPLPEEIRQMAGPSR